MVTVSPPTDTIDAAGVSERVPWEAARARMDWRQGEHVTLIGPTGRGKTELLTELLDIRRYNVFLGTKRVDSTQARLKSMGYREISDPAQLNVEVAQRVVFRPSFPRRATAAALKQAHKVAFRDLLTRAFAQTSWTVVIDELRYITDFLGLTDEVMLLWLQGRSQGNTVVCGTQRPRHVPLEAYDQATHLFFWHDPDHDNVERVAKIASLNRRAVLATVPNLAHHDVLYVNTVTGDTFVTNTRL
jgi:hypothetical protein